MLVGSKIQDLIIDKTSEYISKELRFFKKLNSYKIKYFII